MRPIRTDLAMELPTCPGMHVTQEEGEELDITRVEITKEGERHTGKAQGNYITLHCKQLCEADGELKKRVGHAIGKELRALLPGGEVLIVGLGNRAVTPDALGPQTAGRVLVTRHVFDSLKEHGGGGLNSVGSISPGVLGVTGVETVEIISGVVEHVKPKAVLAIDALAAGDTSRIGTTVQLCDAGVSPGSGVGNHRRALNRETLGIPVIGIGVPMVVYAATIVQGVFEKIGKEGDITTDVLDETVGEMVVTPREIDQMVDTLADVLSMGINLAVHDLSWDEIECLL